MAKVENAKKNQIIPPEYFSKVKPGCSSFEQCIKVQPLVSSFNSQTTAFKTVTELPNINFRLSEVYIEATVTVTFTSNDVLDTYGTVLPTIIPYATSMINEVRLLCGSSQVSDIRQCNVMYNWQQNVMSNSITRLAEQYNNLTPVAYPSATGKTFRFPFSAFKNDLWSLENGIWPGQHKEM